MKLQKKDMPQLALTQMPYLKNYKALKISMHCWQGDDVHGFWNADGELTGGILSTGNYPGAARTPEELRQDIEKAYSLIPGKHKLNLHAIYLGYR